MQDSRRGNGIPERRQRPGIQLLQCDCPFIQSRHGIDEFLETDVSVACLAAEITFFIWGVAHVEALKKKEKKKFTLVCLLPFLQG